MRITATTICFTDGESSIEMPLRGWIPWLMPLLLSVRAGRSMDVRITEDFPSVHIDSAGPTLAIASWNGTNRFCIKWVGGASSCATLSFLVTKDVLAEQLRSAAAAYLTDDTDGSPKTSEASPSVAATSTAPVAASATPPIEVKTAPPATPAIPTIPTKEPRAVILTGRWADADSRLPYIHDANLSLWYRVIAILDKLWSTHIVPECPDLRYNMSQITMSRLRTGIDDTQFTMTYKHDIVNIYVCSRITRLDDQGYHRTHTVVHIGERLIHNEDK